MLTDETNNPNLGTMELSKKLNRLREERDLPNVAEIARRADVNRSSCYRWFEGAAWPDIREAFRLSRVLRTTVDYLADDTQDDPPPSAELRQDEQLALDFYRSMREHEGSATVVLKVLARMASEGVQARPVAAQQRATATVATSSHRPGSGPAVAADDEGSGEGEGPPRYGPPPGHEHGTARPLGGVPDTTEATLRAEREKKRKKPPKGG